MSLSRRPAPAPRSARATRAFALAAAAVFSMSFVATGCSSSAGTGSGSLAAATPAAAAPASGATLSASEFAAAMARPGTVILDVRTPAEFASGHLAGAKNVDFEAAGFRDAIKALAKDVPYAVYCRSGNRSAQALAVMKELGFTGAYHLGGGVGAWTAAGGTLVK